MKKTLVYFLCVFAFLFILPSICLLSEKSYYQSKSTMEPSRNSCKSQVEKKTLDTLSKKFVVVQGVQMGELIIPAKLSGRTFFCAVDTGADSVFWPAYFNIPGKHTGQVVTTNHLGARNCSEKVMLPEIQIGKEVWKDVVSFAEEGKQIAAIPASNEISTDGNRLHIPELGSGLFLNKIITIDLGRNQLIIHDPQIDIINTMRHDNDQVLPFDRDSSQSPECFPILHCTIAGRATRIVFDSGMSIQGLSLAKWFSESTPAIREHSILEPDGEYFTSNLDWAYGNVKTNAAALTPKEDSSPWAQKANVAGYVGFELLRRYRITIDYTRNKILLQPFNKEQLRGISLAPPLEQFYGAYAIRNKKRWLLQMGY